MMQEQNYIRPILLASLIGSSIFGGLEFRIEETNIAPIRQGRRDFDANIGKNQKNYKATCRKQNGRVNYHKKII